MFVSIIISAFNRSMKLKDILNSLFGNGEQNELGNIDIEIPGYRVGL